MKTKTLVIALSLVLAVAVGALAVLLQKPQKAIGEVFVGTQTQSTTTPQLADLTNLCPAPVGFASSTSGVLDFIDILTPGGGDIAFFDATTSNKNLRTGNTATSSIILAWMPVGMGTTTHKFGIEFKRGLLVDYTGTIATSTIGYRCEGPTS